MLLKYDNDTVFKVGTWKKNNKNVSFELLQMISYIKHIYVQLS